MTKQFTLRGVSHCGTIGLCMLLSGCSSDPASGVPSDRVGALGIVEFQVEDSADETTVVGVDADGQEVGRLELIHGRFALTPMFQDDYPGQPEVDGRKMDVTIFGTKRFVYETAGYGPVMNMPAHPPGEEQLNAFLEDPQVKPILENWGIGFEPFTGLVTEMDVAESSMALKLDSGSDPGTDFHDCSSPDIDCGMPRPHSAPTVKANTCGGGTPAFVAGRVTRTVYQQPEWMIAQCCPAGSGGQSHDWFARKSCPLDDASPFNYKNTCDPHGNLVNYSMAACKSCPGYPAVAAHSCDVTYDAAHSELDWMFQ